MNPSLMQLCSTDWLRRGTCRMSPTFVDNKERAAHVVRQTAAVPGRNPRESICRAAKLVCSLSIEHAKSTRRLIIRALARSI
jgi:hypothetical protein